MKAPMQCILSGFDKPPPRLPNFAAREDATLAEHPSR
jgi:hypothetical protein